MNEKLRYSRTHTQIYIYTHLILNALFINGIKISLTFILLAALIKLRCCHSFDVF